MPRVNKPNFKIVSTLVLWSGHKQQLILAQAYHPEQKQIGKIWALKSHVQDFEAKVVGHIRGCPHIMSKILKPRMILVQPCPLGNNLGQDTSPLRKLFWSNLPTNI